MKKFKFDATTATLTISADFDKALQNPLSDEYALYKQLTTDIPNLTVCRMTHKTPTSYTAQKSGEKFHHNPYKGITFDKMERFISAVDDEEGSYKKEYDRLYAFAMAVGEKKAYAIVANWFVEQFPKYRKEPFYYFTNTPAVLPSADFMKEAA